MFCICGYEFVIYVVDIFCVPKAIPPAPTAAMAIFWMLLAAAAIFEFLPTNWKTNWKA